MKHALITGGAGFIGSHVVDRLVTEGWRVTVVDNFDPFYDPVIKRKNLSGHRDLANFTLIEVDIRDFSSLCYYLTADYDVIIHLAAKAGVQPSIEDPVTYQGVNVIGTQNLLEVARQRGTPQFIFASSSSVYGINPNVPWREDDHVLLPISPYASTKVSGELLGHVYSHLYGMRFIALRFFTVYGPRQRPDLAIHKFARLMQEGRSVPIYGDGSTRRDYTYIDDVVTGIRAAMDFSGGRYEVINIGNSRTVSLSELIRMMKEISGIDAQVSTQPERPGDVPQTYADVSKAKALLGYAPQTELGNGMRAFFDWFNT